MEKVFKYIGLVIILSVLIFVGYVLYNNIFRVENIYTAEFINEGKFVLPDDVFNKISGDKMYVIVMKYNSQGDYSGQIKTNESSYQFSGHVRTTRLQRGGTDSVIAGVEIDKTKNFTITMDQEDTRPYSLVVQISK